MKTLQYYDVNQHYNTKGRFNLVLATDSYVDEGRTELDALPNIYIFLIFEPPTVSPGNI